MPASPPKPPRTLEAWVQTAEPGERFTYARSEADAKSPPPRSVLQRAQALYLAGVVLLVQRREKSGALSYIAQMRKPCPKKP